MKIMSVILGLIFFAGGVYASYWVYFNFDSFETLYLGLYLASSFILMTIGAYLTLLPLALKPKKTKVFIEAKEKIEETNDTLQEPTAEIVITDTDAIRVVQQGQETEELDLLSFTSTENPEFTLFEEHTPSNSMETVSSLAELDVAEAIEDATVVFEAINPSAEEGVADEVIEEAEIITEESVSIFKEDNIAETAEIVMELSETEATELPHEEILDVYEFGVIGIDDWNAQRFIRKLDSHSVLNIKKKNKAGLSLIEVSHNNKTLGYLSRLDVNKISDKLDRLVEARPATILKDGRKVDHLSVTLKFK